MQRIIKATKRPRTIQKRKDTALKKQQQQPKNVFVIALSFFCKNHHQIKTEFVVVLQ